MTVKTQSSRVVRRSFALPKSLIEEATSLAPDEIRGNANRLVRVALEEFVARHRQAELDEALARMAADPQIVKESRTLSEEFRSAESDGLPS